MNFDEILTNITQSQSTVNRSAKIIDESIRVTQEFLANAKMRSFVWDPSKKEEFINQLCNPDYVLTAIDELICQKLLRPPTMRRGFAQPRISGISTDIKE